MSDDEIKLCVDALWDNAVDGRIADRHLGSDFATAERHLKSSFVTWLRMKEATA